MKDDHILSTLVLGNTATHVKNLLKKYMVNEAKSNRNYLSDKGKKLMYSSKIGSKGNYVYLFTLDTSENKKALAAFKKSFS